MMFPLRGSKVANATNTKDIMNKEQLVTPVGGHKTEYHFAENNHLYLPFDNDIRTTRLSVIEEYRHKGLIVTYVDTDDVINTEMYISNEIDDANWTKSVNWKKLNL